MKKLGLSILALALIGGSPDPALAQEPEFSPEKTLMERIEDSPNAIPLYPDNPLKDVRVLFNDFKHNPKRDPGPIDIQRTTGGDALYGHPDVLQSACGVDPGRLEGRKR